jgi:predicted nucleic acid-binding protein
MVLATALVGHADLIVSGDKRHLLALGQYEGIPILSPAAAVERLEAKGLV